MAVTKKRIGWAALAVTFFGLGGIRGDIQGWLAFVTSPAGSTAFIVAGLAVFGTFVVAPAIRDWRARRKSTDIGPAPKIPFPREPGLTYNGKAKHRIGWNKNGWLVPIVQLKDAGTGWPTILREVQPASGGWSQGRAWGNGLEEELARGEELVPAERFQPGDRFFITWKAQLANEYIEELIAADEIVIPLYLPEWRASCRVFGDKKEIKLWLRFEGAHEPLKQVRCEVEVFPPEGGDPISRSSSPVGTTHKVIHFGNPLQTLMLTYPDQFVGAPDRPLPRGRYEAVWYWDDMDSATGFVTTRLVTGHRFDVGPGETVECDPGE